MPFVATTSLRKLVLLLLASVAFVAAGFWMLSSPRPDHPDTVWGWLGVIFFGLCAVVFLVQLISPRQRLTIDSYGVTWIQRSDRTIPWSAIKNVELLDLSRAGKFLAITLVDPAAYPPARSPRRPGPSLSTRMYSGDLHISLKPLDRSVKDVMSAVAQYWPPRDR